MKRGVWRYIVIGMVIAGVLLIGHLSWQNSGGDGTASAGSGFTLAPPAFGQTVSKSFLEKEAGISLYVNAGQKLDLAKAKSLFEVLEDETDNYIIGTVALPQYGEEWWPHVWIHKDGWIVVYYLKDEPTSRLMHWLSFKEKISTTTLREVMLAVAGALGADLSKVEANMRYYHWQYPEAKKLLVVLDSTGAGSDTFKYSIPAALSLYEVSAAHYGNVGSYYGHNWSRTKIDGDMAVR